MRFHTLLLVSTLTLGSTAHAAPVEQKPTQKPHQLSLENRPWQGDFDAMLERRKIRVLVPYSRTLYYVDKGHERGVAADLLRDFERYINNKYAKQLGKRPLTVYIIPTTRDKLLGGINKGLGDIAAGNLTVTEDRQRIVDFVATKDSQSVNEVLITGPKSPAVATLDDLSGKTVHVRQTSSYYQSVLALNRKLKSAGKATVKITLLPDALEDEDILDMLNAGLFEFAVVDAWKARIWSQTLPDIKVREDIALRSEGQTGWAIRKKSPKLVEALRDYDANHIVKTGGLNTRIAGTSKRIQQISNNTDSAEIKRFESTLKLFEKYGSKYRFDPLMLAAQGYQESKLNQNARSHAGAIGVMQIMPATGKGLQVGNIKELEANIHGGAKYMDQLMTRYFPDAKFSEADRPLFAFASYNAGPGNISKIRALATQRGLDPNQWFNNVEIIVSEKIGLETTTYVRNIYKYYTAYKLILDAQQVQQKAREKVGG
jgi:membrane-bound lytic murein transglycosylase MltF